MTLCAALLMPGSPLPYVQRDNPPWGELAQALDAAGAALQRSGAETIVVYSTQWIAVLDQLWQMRAHVKGVHVDENWHEYGDLPFDMRIDTVLTGKIIEATPAIGIRSKGVDYDGFPVDTGAIVAANFLDPKGSMEFALTSNNVYHDWDMTYGLGTMVAEQARALGRKIAVVGVGGLSGSIYRHTIDIATDKIANQQEDDWNRKILDLMVAGDIEGLTQQCPEYAGAARVDMGFKHFAFILGAMGGRFSAATVHGYGPLYGAGGAIVEFALA
ncbi:MAG: tRNA U-34 5-methylaminomethyl-2-thiouridine biosynthesis protein [Pseudomonadota bacterium]